MIAMASSSVVNTLQFSGCQGRQSDGRSKALYYTDEKKGN